MTLTDTLQRYLALGLNKEIDYDKYYLYSLITHSTAIEGSTMTEVENQLLFDQGIASQRPMTEQLMNLDLKNAYLRAIQMAKEGAEVSTRMLCALAASVMKNTGTVYHTLQGDFNSSRGQLRLVNVTAGAGGRSYMNHLKVPQALKDLCQQIYAEFEAIRAVDDVEARYRMTFDAHFRLVTIHPWVDGNGRMARLLMHYLQMRLGLVPVKVTSQHKAQYIQALIDSRELDDLVPFRAFMTAEHIANLQAEIDTHNAS